MITIITNKINTLNQTSYNSFIDSLNLWQCQCSCGHHGTLVKHGYYLRNLKGCDEIMIRLSILRVKCSHCGKTHAILPSCIVPYSCISLQDHVDIIYNSMNGKTQEEIMKRTPLIDESNISYILRIFKRHWEQRLFAFSISLKCDISMLVQECFQHCSRQFMQIKSTSNILSIPIHIT